jgi:predicted ATPase
VRLLTADIIPVAFETKSPGPGMGIKAFESFRLDTVNHCLWRAGERMALTPKAFDILRYLVEHSERLVAQDELLEALWPETYVNPEGVRKYILEIRKVLGDRPKQPLFIETLPKRGYQFVAKVTDEGPLPPVGPVIEAAGNMVGRSAALEQLNHHLEKASAGQRQVIFITGEAGIGKTTLVDAFQQQAARHPHLRIARGQCIEGFGEEEAYYPILEALGSLIRNAEDDSLVQILAKRAPTWLAQFPSLVNTEQNESLQREILGSTRGRMVREICEALDAITAQTPLVVILEDLHWVDTSTLDLISAFARRREPAKLLLIGTYRPVEVVLSQSPLKALKQDLQMRDLCHEIAIEHLEESDVAEYLAKEFADSDFPAGLAELVHHNSGGNPLFMAAVVRDIVKRGLIAQEQGRWILTAPLQDIYPGIPETLQQMLEIQFEQLGAQEQRILETCSVAGERFSVWAVAAMLETSPDTVEEECDKLASRQQFIRSVGIHDGPNGVPSAYYEFMHSLYRQALHGSLSGLNRTKLHRSLGELLMPICTAGKLDLASELALHFEEGRDYEQATRCLMLASQNAARRFSYRDSILILRHALKFNPSLAAGTRQEVEIEILQRIGDAHSALGEMSDAAVSYEAAADRAATAGVKPAQADALVRLATAVRYRDPDRGHEVYEQAIEISKSLDPLRAAQTQLAAGSFRLLYGAWRKEDQEACARAQEIIRRLSGSSVPQDASYIYVQAIQGNYREAMDQAQTLLATSTDPTTYVQAAAAMTFALMPLGRLGEILRFVRTGIELAEKNGESPWIHIFCEVWLRGICFDYEGVRRVAESSMRNDAEHHALRVRTIGLVASGYGSILQCHQHEALQCFAQVRDSKSTPRFLLHWYWRTLARHGTAEAHLSAGDVVNARAEADGFLQSALSTADPGMQTLGWELKSRVASAENNHAAAGQYINNALAIADSRQIPVVAWRVHATAWDWYRGTQENEKAEGHRARAQELIMKMADSFEPGEPLRESLLAAAPVRRLFERAVSER